MSLPLKRGWTSVIQNMSKSFPSTVTFNFFVTKVAIVLCSRKPEPHAHYIGLFQDSITSPSHHDLDGGQHKVFILFAS